MARVVILGAGFGGLAVAYRLKKLVRNNGDITVVSDSDKYFYRPSLPYVALGNKSLNNLFVPLPQAMSMRDIEFVKSRVYQISPTNNTVETDSGNFKYDCLAVAVGSEIAFDEITGAKEYGYVLCEANCIMNLRTAIENFKGGAIAIILTQNNPFELMDIGFTFALDHLLRRRGLRNNTQLRYFTPNSYLLPHLGERSRNVFAQVFRKKSIETYTAMKLIEVKKDSVLFNGNKEFSSHLSVLVPPYRGRQVVAQSGLANDRGYISTDHTMRSLRNENVYAIGDAVCFDGPKSGRRAMLQGKVAGENIAAHILGHQNTVRFEERDVKCIIEMGGSEAAYIRSDIYWGGSSERVWTGTIPYWMKVWLEKRFLYKKGDI